MDKTLGAFFMASKGSPIQYDGKEVHMMWSMGGASNTVLSIKLVSVSTSVRQGLVLSAKAGEVLINGLKTKKAVLWMDTAPDTIQVSLRPKQTNMTINIWNTWEDDHGVQHAWIGNCGMAVEQSKSAVLLRCSCGVGPVDFTNLVVLVSIMGG